MRFQSPKHRLHHFFAGMSEHVFQTRLGVVDPPLTDYITDMLMRFIRSDHPQRVLSRRGSDLHDLSRMLWETDQQDGPQDRRQVHRLIGDMALFWTGLFPESLESGSTQQTPGQFSAYCSQGKRAYLIASKLDITDTEDASGDVLKRLAEQFEICAAGLRTIRQQWKESTDTPGLPPEMLLD
jgi:hypothetical protein